MKARLTLIFEKDFTPVAVAELKDIAAGGNIKAMVDMFNISNNGPVSGHVDVIEPPCVCPGDKKLRKGKEHKDIKKWICPRHGECRRD